MQINKMPPPKFDVIIQKCWLDALRMAKMQKPQIHVCLKGSTQFGKFSSWLITFYVKLVTSDVNVPGYME